MSAGSGSHVNSAGSPQLRWWAHPRSKKTMLLGGSLGLVGLLGWIWFFRPYVFTDDARIATTLVRLAPEGVSGKVVKLGVTEGDRVKSGQLLLELDHAVAKANLMKATVKATQSERELKRVEQIAAQHGVPPNQVDNLRALAQTAEAELQLAQIHFDRTFLRSPVDGIVVQKVTEIGNILEPNQTAVTVADIDHAWVSANIEETAVAAIKVGQSVSVEIDEGGVLTGKVSEVRSATASQFALIQSENPSGNFTKLVQRIPIKVELDAHPQRQLRAGQSVELKIRVR